MGCVCGMDIPLSVTPELFDVLQADMGRTWARVEPDKLRSIVVRVRFDGWMNSEVEHAVELARSYYDLEHLTLARFAYVGHYREREAGFVAAPLDTDSVSRGVPGDTLETRYYVTIAVCGLYFNHDVYAATVPFHEVDLQVSAPRVRKQLRICATKEVADGRISAPLLFERLLRVRVLPWLELQASLCWEVLSRVQFDTRRSDTFATLRKEIASRRVWLPRNIQNSSKALLRHAGTVAQQWMYWAMDVGAEHTRCDNYALLVLLFGHECVTHMPDHECLHALMYLAVLHPEALCCGETIALVCRAVRQPAFLRLASALQNAPLLAAWGGASTVLQRALQFARRVLENADMEHVASVHESARSGLVHKAPAAVLVALRALDVAGVQMCNIPDASCNLQQPAERGACERTVMQALQQIGCNEYRRAQSRAVRLASDVIADARVCGCAPVPCIETETNEAVAGQEHTCSVAALADRYVLVQMLAQQFRPLLIMVMHYQLQIVGVQTCVREHGLPYIVVCPNKALREQAAEQWSHTTVLSAGRLVEALMSSEGDELLFPRGPENPMAMLVLLHGEMLGIEQWLAILRATRAKLHKMARVPGAPETLRSARPVVVLVTDVFLERPVVVRPRFPRVSVYGTESVAVQLAFCDELFEKQTVLTESDVPSHSERIPFQAACLYYKLTNGKNRYAKASSVQSALLRFLRMLVERMWLDDDALYAHLEMQLDGFALPKIYMHTGYSNFTDRKRLREETFKENDYIHLADTGELLALRVAPLSGAAASVEGKGRFGLVARTGTIALQTNAFERGYLCECAVPVFTPDCDRYVFDAQSPWYLHDSVPQAPRGELSTAVVPDLLHRAEANGRPVMKRGAACVHSTPCAFPPLTQTRHAPLCSTHYATFSTRPTAVLRESPAHVSLACTRDMPVAVSSYTGPSPNAVYVNVADKTPAVRFLFACSRAREHVQVVYSKQERGEQPEGETRRGRMQFQRATDDYVQQLREARAEGEVQWNSAVDSVVSALLEKLLLRATIYPEDGLWAREMFRLCTSSRAATE